MDEPTPITNEGWVNSRWRPMMAWQCFAVALCDFIVFPALVQIQNMRTGAFHEWHSLTLQGGGLYWLAMGGIVGVAVWQRTEEKKAIYSAFGGGTSSSMTSTVVEKHTTDTVRPAVEEQAASGRKD